MESLSKPRTWEEIMTIVGRAVWEDGREEHFVQKAEFAWKPRHERCHSDITSAEEGRGLEHTEMQVRPERQTGSGLDWARESNLQILNFTLKIMKVKVKLKVAVVSDSLWPHGLYSRWTSPGQNTRVGSLSLLQGILPTQGLNPGLLHCR